MVKHHVSWWSEDNHRATGGSPTVRHTYLPPSLSDKLNTSYTCFENYSKDDPVCLRALTMSRANVSRALRCTNPLKSPESISGQSLRACADQLADV